MFHQNSYQTKRQKFRQNLRQNLIVKWSAYYQKENRKLKKQINKINQEIQHQFFTSNIPRRQMLAAKGSQLYRTVLNNTYFSTTVIF